MNGCRNIMLSVRITNRPPLRIRKLNQLNINQSNTYKGLSLLIFDDEPKVQERQKVKNHQSYLFVFVAYLTFPNSSKEQQPKHENNIPYKVVW